MDQARRAADLLLENFPDVSVARIRDTPPFKRKEDIDLWVEGLGKAGLAE